MGDFSNGFWSGLLNTVNKDIVDRHDKADEWFQKQTELAYTRGIENKKKLESKSQMALSSAKQLQAMGMPVDLVKGIAAQNPDDIPTIAEQLASLQAKGYKTDDSFFRAWVQSKEDFSENNEDLGSFFKRIYQPLSRNVEADPEGMKRDPVGGFWATVMGYNAMDRARDKLSTTEVVEGYSAADLLGMDPSNLTPGDNTTVLNYGTYGDAVRSTQPPRRDSNNSNKPLTPATINLYKKSFEEKTKEILMEEAMASGNSGDPTPEQKALAQSKAIEALLGDYGEDVLKVPSISDIYYKDSKKKEGVGKTTPAEPSGAPQTAVPPISATPLPKSVEEPVEAPSTSPVALPPDGTQLGGVLVGWTLIKRLGDGTVVMLNPDGEKVRMREEELLKVVMSE